MNYPQELVGCSPAIRGILDLVNRVARTDATVLLVGETGTGKELVARRIHDVSLRASRRFLAVNCGAIPQTLIESELFGYARGAFTGATCRKAGKFEAADGGTVFLDEVSSMSEAMQVDLLRVLQSGEYSPVGSTLNLSCDVRIIAASNQDIGPLIESGRFRADLYYRLNIIRMELPPLRRRREDIPPLAAHYLAGLGAISSRPARRLSPEALELLLQHEYPGNVRELENILRRADILCSGDMIGPEDLPPEVRDRSRENRQPPRDFHQAKALAIEEFERAYLTASLERTGGIISRAARSTGLSERNFHVKLRRYGIQVKSPAPSTATDVLVRGPRTSSS